MNNKGLMALTQIFVLLIGIIAISYAIGGGIGVVSGSTMADDEIDEVLNVDDDDIFGMIQYDKDVASATNPTETIGMPDVLPKGEIKNTNKKSSKTEDKKGGLFAGMGATMSSLVLGLTITAGLLAIVNVLRFIPDVEGESNWIDAASAAIGAGGTVGSLITSLLVEGDVAGDVSKLAGGGIGALIGIAVFVMVLKFEHQKIYNFDCQPWDAPVGGNNCDLCNQDDLLGCSEYQCRSLGQACQLVNSEDSGEAMCVWVHRDDHVPPQITSWANILTEDYEYTPNTAIALPDEGVKIISKDQSDGNECVSPFEPIEFGIILNEPAKCKMSVELLDIPEGFEKMPLFFGGTSLSKMNHSQIISIPSREALESENITLKTGDQDLDIYVRCQDANGNSNEANYVFSFCVDDAPDVTPPRIMRSSIPDGSPFSFNQTKLDIAIYVNEPASCKWDISDKSYDQMENNLKCEKDLSDMDKKMTLPCTGTLDGLKDFSVETPFYFRCNDTSGNANTESFKIGLIGSQPLVIKSIEPEGTRKDSSSSVRVQLEVETSAGYDSGKAHCQYSESCTEIGGSKTSWTSFEYSDAFSTHLHEALISASSGKYECAIRCSDFAGNADVSYTNYTIETDREAPIVVRAYYDDNKYLKLITNEEAECVYHTKDCDYPFADGVKMTTHNSVNHVVEWKTDTFYYVKCKDIYSREPTPQNVCSIIVKPFTAPEPEEE